MRHRVDAARDFGEREVLVHRHLAQRPVRFIFRKLALRHDDAFRFLDQLALRELRACLGELVLHRFERFESRGCRFDDGRQTFGCPAVDDVGPDTAVDGLAYDVKGSDGAAVGNNPNSTVPPGQTVEYRLYADVERYARGIGAARLTCEVNVRPRNEVSLAFHERMGFTGLDERETEYGLRVLMMEKPL